MRYTSLKTFFTGGCEKEYNLASLKVIIDNL